MPSNPATPEICLDQIVGDNIDAAWPHIEPLLQRGIDQVATTQTTASILKAADEGRFMLWCIYRRDKPLPLLAAAATYIRPTNKGLVSVIDTIGGNDMSTWLHPALAQFEALARANGIGRIEIEGRRGWGRRLPGFKATRIVLEKALQT